jgi:hypothetical protein
MSMILPAEGEIFIFPIIWVEGKKKRRDTFSSWQYSTFFNKYLHYAKVEGHSLAGNILIKHQQIFT